MGALFVPLTMVRPVIYHPVKAFKLGDAEKEKYAKIAAEIKTKTPEAKKSVGSITDALTTCAGYQNTAWDPVKDDKVEASEIILDYIDADISDIKFEEPTVVKDDDDDADGEERSLWGDGDNEPGAT